MATLSTSAYSEQPENITASREQLILDHLPQVNWIATRIHEKLPGNTNLEDLISIGIIGLINAIDNFDASFNVKLKTYAEYKICVRSWTACAAWMASPRTSARD